MNNCPDCGKDMTDPDQPHAQDCRELNDQNDHFRSALEIPRDILDKVVAALSRAISLSLVRAPSLHAGFVDLAIRLDEAINDALATEE